MIIRITVKDNDFGKLIEAFGKDLIFRPYRVDVNKKDYEELHQYIHDDEDYRKYIGKASSECTQEQKLFVETMVRKHFEQYVHNISSKDYLVKNFTVEVVDSINDEWRNGEDFFVFPSSYGENILNF